MTPHRSNQRGTLMIDRAFRSVGRFRMASGTSDGRVFRRLNDMLDALVDQGRLDLMRAMLTRKLTVLQVYDAYRLGELDRLPSVDMLIPLRGALATFAETYGCSDKHRESLWTAHNHLDRIAPADAKVPALPDALKLLRVSLSGTPRAFNIVRSAAQSFARSQYGKGSKLWLAVSQVEPLKVTPQRVKHPATVAELLTVTTALPTTMLRDGKTVRVDFAGMAWTLATTGMRTIVEYFAREWSVKSGFLEIGTGKKDKAIRRVPLLRTPVEPGSVYKPFREALHAASQGQMTPYDLRRTYATWLEAAGVPRTRRRLYLGHGNLDIGDRYEWHEVKAFLAEDALKVKAWLEAEIKAAKKTAKPTLSLSR